jgi:SAM-dependent methyltransferase
MDGKGRREAPGETNSVKSNSEWVYWGEKDPLFGVSSEPGRSRVGANPWTDADFYNRSVNDWADCLAQWRPYGLNPASCMEIGCGTGRMTRHLEKYFSQVYALDVSQGMIEYAGRHCDPSVVKFFVTDGAHIPLQDGCITAAFSTICFQHLHSPADGVQYFSEIHRVLASGGTMMINLPVFEWPISPLSLLLRMVYGVSVASSGAAANARRLLMRSPRVMRTKLGRKLGEHMHATFYERRWLWDRLSSIGFQDLRLHGMFVATEHRYHAFVLGRKA